MPHLVHVGNSLGVRIPKAIISQIGFTEDTNLQFKVTAEGLLISPVRNRREGWDEAFKEAKQSKKEQFFLGEQIDNTFDKDEWEW